MTTLETLKDRYFDVKERVAKAAERAGQDPARVVIVAVSKYSPIDEVRELMGLGHRDFGESQVQQLIQRAAVASEWNARHRLASKAVAAPAGPPGNLRWHLVGHLQRNKVKKAVELARLIHSVDSLRLAEEVQAAATRLDTIVEVLLQVNCSGEESKFGCAVPAAYHLAENMESMLNVRLRGLMTMAAPAAAPDETRPTFARLRELMDDLKRAGIGSGRPAGAGFELLSMGMSGDYEAAIAEGANIVRLGSAIFGAQQGLAPHHEAEAEQDAD